MTFTIQDRMSNCELCGANLKKKSDRCPRCGFVFQKEVRADSRDKAILEKHEGKSVDTVNRALKDGRAKLAAYLDNVVAKNLSREELVSLLDESLAYLQVPQAMGVDDVLRFDDDEKMFIVQISKHLEQMDGARGEPNGTLGTYVRLSNALHSLGDANEAMRMIEKALLINPKDRDAMFSRAKLLLTARKYQAARRCLEKIIAADPGDDDARSLAELIEQLDR
jgi:tetratricopeptide (TPR) repeat protein